jgi:thioredoxin 1
MSRLIAETNEGNFTDTVLDMKQPVVVDFWAEWCGPCRTLAPVIEGLAEQYAGAARIVKLNVDENPSLAERFRVMAIPTLILFQNGEEKERMIGSSQRESIARMIDAYVTTEVS